MASQKHEFTREEFYALVWAEPMVKVAARFGLSDVGLKKMCRRCGIPVPGRGYWRKLETGKRTKLAPLPVKETSELLVLWTQSDGELAFADKIYASIQDHLEFESRPENLIAVAQHLSRPHALTVETRRRLGSLDWRYGMAVCRSPTLFRVRVSKESVARAVRIVDALYKALEKRGLRVTPASYDRGDASVVIDGEDVQFTLEETTRQQTHTLSPAETKHKEKHGWSRASQYDYVPSRKLTLKITSYYWGSGLTTVWKDKNDVLVETKLNEFMQALRQVAAYRRHETLKREVEERRREAAEERLREIHRRKEAEAKAVRDLFDAADLWTKVDVLRSYVGAVKAEALRRNVPSNGDTALGRWLEWAESKMLAKGPLAAAFEENAWKLPN